MTARLFVAVWPPDEVLDALESLHRPEKTGVRWTTREQWHVTLHFLGRCDPVEAWRRLDLLRSSVAEARLGPRSQQLSGSALALPVDGLDALAAGVSDALAGIGVVSDPRSFRGHLTLARARRGASLPAPVELKASWRVASVALVESGLHPDGARYETVGRVSLGSGTVGT